MQDLPTAIKWSGESTLQISLDHQPGREFASHMLRHTEVRSVVVHRPARQATVHLKEAQPSAEVVLQLAAFATGEGPSPVATVNGKTEIVEVAHWHDAQTETDAYFRAPQMATGAKRIALLAGALATFVLAVLGAILPGLPTTPFLLLTSYCLLRSSRRLHVRLLRSRMFGWLLRDWYINRGVRPGVKTKSLAVLVLIVGATVAFSGLPPWALAGIVGCALIGVVCILRLRVIR